MKCFLNRIPKLKIKVNCYAHLLKKKIQSIFENDTLLQKYKKKLFSISPNL